MVQYEIDLIRYRINVVKKSKIVDTDIRREISNDGKRIHVAWSTLREEEKQEKQNKEEKEKGRRRGGGGEEEEEEEEEEGQEGEKEEEKGRKSRKRRRKMRPCVYAYLFFSSFSF